MDPRLKPKSDLYLFAGFALIFLALVVNPLSVKFLQTHEFWPKPHRWHMLSNDVRLFLPLWLDSLLLFLGGMMVWAPKRLGYYFNNRLWFNLLLFFICAGIVSSLNIIQAGRWIIPRIVLFLGLLFMLTNAFYLAVVSKQHARILNPVLKNVAVSVYGILALLILLEGVFLFHRQSHRFNGTLGSRSWFNKYWQLNSEGYRDFEYAGQSFEGKQKIMVLGDSFVSGHGVKDAKDRFSDQLQQLLPKEKHQVFNLGVNGVDTKGAFENLRHFPIKPDVLIISWYPNDMELDGQEAGLLLQRARSYHDLWAPFRYVVRRSYLWNYIYWQYPHPDELSDYFGFIRQCFQSQRARRIHLGHLNELIEYAEGANIKTMAVVFPFLERMQESGFASDPIVEHFRDKGIPTVDVRRELATWPLDELLVNDNDPHPSEKLHHWLGEELFAKMQEMGLAE